MIIRHYVEKNENITLCTGCKYETEKRLYDKGFQAFHCNSCKRNNKLTDYYEEEKVAAH